MALVVGRAAGAAGFADLANAAAAGRRAEEAQALYDFGYACIGTRGAGSGGSRAAGGALRRSAAAGRCRTAGAGVGITRTRGRHREAVTELVRRGAPRGLAGPLSAGVQRPCWRAIWSWPGRQHAAVRSEDAQWQPARDRQETDAGAGRRRRAGGPPRRGRSAGWQYVMGGTVLGTLSPRTARPRGMNGRYAWVQDTPDQYAAGSAGLQSRHWRPPGSGRGRCRCCPTGTRGSWAWPRRRC
ncbi:hypothetical protein LT493_02395 [Streptomyces tricolor]|nr:hypothetical protein [Streptomyces tricolor]